MTICLTVRQPFATRIVTGGKHVENRSRPTSIRGQFLVHAGARVHDHYTRPDLIDPALLGRSGQPTVSDAVLEIVQALPRASVIGAAQLIDSHNAASCPDWVACLDDGGFRPTLDEPVVHHWVLADPVEFVTPIPRVLGALGFWQPDDRVKHLASLELEAAAARA